LITKVLFFNYSILIFLGSEERSLEIVTGPGRDLSCWQTSTA